MDRSDEARATAHFAWALLVFWVVGYDVWALVRGAETLSAAFWRAKSTPRWRVMVALGWLGLTWHLLAGDKPVLADRYRRWYRRCHPLYVAYDLLVFCADIRADGVAVVMDEDFFVNPLGSNKHPKLQSNDRSPPLTVERFVRFG